MDSKKPDLVEEPDATYGYYSYADYLTWPMDLVAELIHGKVFKKAAAAPKRIHQKVASKLNFKLYQFLEGKMCQVYPAPFDECNLAAIETLRQKFGFRVGFKFAL